MPHVTHRRTSNSSATRPSLSGAANSVSNSSPRQTGHVTPGAVTRGRIQEEVGAGQRLLLARHRGKALVPAAAKRIGAAKDEEAIDGGAAEAKTRTQLRSL